MGPTMPQQPDLFGYDASWVHLFRALVMGGDAGRMGGSVFLVYAVIKTYASHTTGFATPTVQTIAEKANLSDAQVERHIRTLVDLGYLTRQRVGRRNQYRLREKVSLVDPSGEVGAVATWDYIPAAVQAATTELRNYRQTGRHGWRFSEAGQVIHIDRLVVSIGDHNTINVADNNDNKDGS